ncbi:MAG TPA: DUF4386 domain-containing protein [Chryseolinea sp.]|nr:DUF4386 domain-containing protein [Chryseolinea sp.]
MEALLRSNSKTARLAASLFFFVCIPLFFWEDNYVRSKIFVAQDPIATANNLLSHEFVFRAATITHVAGTIIYVFMMMMFVRLFRPVDKHLSRLMIAPLLVQIPIVLILEVFNIAALMTLKSEARPSFDIGQQQEAAYFLLRMYRFGMGTGKLFFGLSLIPFGMLVLKSGFTPRIIGILLIIGGVGYVGDFSIYVLLQRPDYVMVRSILMFTYLTYMLALLWFLIKGVRDPYADR